MYLCLGVFYRGLVNWEIFIFMLCVFFVLVCVISWFIEIISGGKIVVFKKSILYGLLVCV